MEIVFCCRIALSWITKESFETFLSDKGSELLIDERRCLIFSTLEIWPMAEVETDKRMANREKQTIFPRRVRIRFRYYFPNNGSKL